MLASVASTAFVVGLGAGAAFWRGKATPYWETRLGFVRTALSITEPRETLVLGDSISESLGLDEVCGPTFNAAIGSAHLRTVAEIAPTAVAAVKPKRIILEVGANDFYGGRDDPAFPATYAALVKQLPGKVILVGIPNNTKANNFVRQFAAANSLTFVEPVVGSLTSDGVHPNTTGARILKQRIRAAC